MHKTILDTTTARTATIGNIKVFIPTCETPSFLIKDEHKEDNLARVFGLIKLNNGQHAVWMDAPMYCCNAIELNDEGTCYLSKVSIAGTVRNGVYGGWYDTYPIETISFEDETQMAVYLEDH